MPRAQTTIHDVDTDAPADEQTTDGFWLSTVGIDVGSATSHLTVSRLRLERLGITLSTRYVVVERQIVYRSPIMLTPYLAGSDIDADRVTDFVRRCYAQADVDPEHIDAGAIILTGAAVRRRNARALGERLSERAGTFVCLTAGADLETIMAAHGSGAVARSRSADADILMVDIGGGTTKLALIRDAAIQATGVIDLGGRIVASDGGRITRVEPTARRIAARLAIDLEPGGHLDDEHRMAIGREIGSLLAGVLAGGSLPPDLADLWLTAPLQLRPGSFEVLFSGGVSEFLRGESEDFGDLGRAIALELSASTGFRRVAGSPPNAGIRSTVLGTAQYTVQASGSTIFVSNRGDLPVRNAVVVPLRRPLTTLSLADARDEIADSFRAAGVHEGVAPALISLPWQGPTSYAALRHTCEALVSSLPRTRSSGAPLIVAVDRDIAFLLGSVLVEDMHWQGGVICLDEIDVGIFEYVDIGQYVEGADVVPVVVKSLVFPSDATRPSAAPATPAVLARHP